MSVTSTTNTQGNISNSSQTYIPRAESESYRHLAHSNQLSTSPHPKQRPITSTFHLPLNHLSSSSIIDSKWPLSSSVPYSSATQCTSAKKPSERKSALPKGSGLRSTPHLIPLNRRSSRLCHNYQVMRVLCQDGMSLLASSKVQADKVMIDQPDGWIRL